VKALCKKQTTLQAVGYLGFPAPGDKLIGRSHPARSWQHKMKHCNLMLYLQLSNSKDKVFLPLVLKIYRSLGEKADLI